MRIALACVAALAAACNSKQTAPVQSAVTITTVGPAGGTVNGQGDLMGAQINIPPGALPQQTPITMGDDPQPPPDPMGYTAAGPSMLCSPEGLTFLRPATVLVPFIGDGDVELFTAPGLPDAGWEWVDGGLVNDVQQVILSTTTHFSRFRAYRPPGIIYSDAGIPTTGG